MEPEFGDRNGTAEGLIERVKLLEAYIADMQQRLALHEEVKQGNFWYWQGDGYDCPESLVCPVVMRADTLRQLIGKDRRPQSPVRMHETFLDVVRQVEQLPQHEQRAISIALYSVINARIEVEQDG